MGAAPRSGFLFQEDGCEDLQPRTSPALWSSNLHMPNLQLEIEKMHCGACVRRVTQTLNSLPSTHAKSVQIGAAQVETEADPQTLVQALHEAGFPARMAASQP